MIDDHGHAAVARYQVVPKRGDFAMPGEHVHVLTLHAYPAILSDEAAVVSRAARRIAWDAVILGDVHRRIERDQIAVYGDRHERGDGATRRAAAPWVRLRVELVETDVLSRARTQLRAFTVALGEADGAAARQCAAALDAQRFVERARDALDRFAARILQRHGFAAKICLAGEVVVGVAEGAQNAPARRARVEFHGRRADCG